MASRRAPTTRPAPGDRAQLRAEVLELGGALGWQPHEVISFTEALTGCPWQRCGCPDLEAVRAEYQTLIEAIAAKVARPTAGERRVTRDPGPATRDTPGGDHAIGP